MALRFLWLFVKQHYSSDILLIQVHGLGNQPVLGPNVGSTTSQAQALGKSLHFSEPR